MGKSIACVLAVCAGGVSAAQAQELFGVGNFGNAFQAQTLYRINQSTGAATPIGSTGLSQIAGISWDGTSLWAMTVAADLYRLNVNTGAATLVAAQASTLPEGDISFSGGVLYHTSSAGMVSTVDTATGALTPFVDISAGGSDFSGLTATGTLSAALALNGTGDDSLVIFGPEGVVGSVLTGTNGLSVGGLASDGTRAWMTDGSSLFELSPTSGVATLLGGHGVGGMSGLAFVPAPGAAGLLALGALAAGRRRR